MSTRKPVRCGAFVVARLRSRSNNRIGGGVHIQHITITLLYLSLLTRLVFPDIQIIPTCKHKPRRFVESGGRWGALTPGVTSDRRGTRSARVGRDCGCGEEFGHVACGFGTRVAGRRRSEARGQRGAKGGGSKTVNPILT